MTEWSPENYNPKLSVGDWERLLQDREIFSISDLEIMKRFLDFGLDFFSFNSAKDTECKATFQQLAFTYGETYEFYKDHIYSLVKRILNVTSCPVFTDTGDKIHYENILLLERQAGTGAKKNNPNNKMYKLRDEFIAALATVDFSNIQLYTDEKIFEKINIESETTANQKKIDNTLATLQYVFVDSNNDIPIKPKHASDDDKNYFAINAETGNMVRIVDKVAVSLLARGFTYKISEKESDAIKRDVKAGKIEKKYFPISAERYREIIAAIMI